MVEITKIDGDKTFNSTSDIRFNMAFLFYVGLHELLQAKERAAICENWKLWFNISKQIYYRVSFKICPNDQKALKALFGEIQNYFNCTEKRSLQNQKDKIILNKVPILLEEIDARLMNILDENNMIFPRLENFDGIKNLSSRYNLN